MPSTIRKIGLLIMIIIVLPVLVFSIFEIGNLRQNEKIIRDIYKNQLDAILYSINQYSDDVMSNLAFRIENFLGSGKQDSEESLYNLLSETPAVKCFMRFDADYKFISAVPDTFLNVMPVKIPQTKLLENDSVINRLQTYLRGGYRKMETQKSEDNNQWIVFLMNINDQVFINLLIIDPEKFVSHVLDPKIQQIARDRFYIAAYKIGASVPFYSTDKSHLRQNSEENRAFWLLENYTMGIELTELTIDDLTRERMRRNLLLIGIMDVILLLGAFIIFRNIKKQVELSQLKSDFVSGVSHEIRTPLALISMYIETLEMGRVKSAEKVREYYSVILIETTRLSGIVNRILNFSQIENNKRKYTFAPLDLNEVAESTGASFKHTLDSKSFEYFFEPVEGLPSIMADRDAVCDALGNLIDNAVKYSTDKKVLTIRTGLNGKYVYLEVEDQGIGISAKNQKYIFDKFFRVTERNLANKVKGSGLGLAIVQNIMDAHKGSIFVKSVPGEGSLFRLLFPMRK
jgi:two-component system phosphate regulon sensor histidine kinase PhoR